MKYLYEYANTMEIVKKYGFSFKKKFGQNFLTNKQVIEDIITGASITEDDVVLEIGPGIGTLTQLLAERAKKVIAVEIDNTLIPILKNDTLKEFNNVEIINEDIMKIDLEKLIEEKAEGKKIKVVANLPYYITTPIVMMLLEKRLKIESITIMIQKEVAERLNAEAGSKEYGAITVSVDYYTNTEIVCIAPKEYFMPSPKVDSAVIRLDVLDKPKVEVKNEKLFFNVIKSAFAQRRKTLVNCLYSTTGLFESKDEIVDILEKCDIKSGIRGEKLSIEEFKKLADKIYEVKNESFNS